MANPQVQQLFQMVATSPLADPTQTLEQMRGNLDALSAMFPPQSDVELAPADTGGVRAEWIRPAAAKPGLTILFLHGGGYTLGSLASHRDLATRIAKAAAANTLAIEYRLAPEHPHPAALDDAMHAYRWLLETGHAAGEIAIVGDSAGAGLAIATALAARDAGIPRPGALALMSPWVDLHCDTPSLVNSADPFMQPGPVKLMAMGYLAGQDPRSPLISPLFAADLSGLPRTLVQVGTIDGLRDDGQRFAELARKAGVDVTYEVWEDMFHAWHMFALMVEDGQRATERVGAFLRAGS
jgi:monoterpene epsilon-lactone hydrolase